MTTTKPGRWALALPLLGALGCGSSSKSDGGMGAMGDAAGDGAGNACLTDTRGQAYTVGLGATGGSGAFKVTMLGADPAPPAAGLNKWIIRVADASDAPVTGVTFTVTPFMPDHGHGTSVKAMITDDGNGQYTLANLNLFLPGYWTVTLDLKAPGGAADTVVFAFCLP